MAADVFMSAATEQMNNLVKGKYISKGDVVELLENKVVLIAPKKGDEKVSSFKDITKADTIALGDPKSVPAGQYAQEILTNLKNWNDVKKKASFGTNVTEVLNWVAKGSASCGVVYATDAASNKDVKVLAEAPADALKTPVIYPVAALKKSKNKDAADKFVKFLHHTDHQRCYKRRKIQERSCSQRRRYPSVVIPWKRSFIRLGSRRRYAS